METIQLRIIPQPLPDAGTHGRVILRDAAVPLVRSDDPLIQYTCGTCGESVIVGLNIKRLLFSYGNAEILVRCNRCGSYNNATPEPFPPYHIYTDLLPKFKDLLAHSTQTHNGLMAEYQSISPNDPRVSVSGQLASVASVAFLNLVNVKTNLSQDQWWKDQGFGVAIETGFSAHLIESYITATSASVIFFSFSLFESGLRRVVRAIDLSACGAGNSDFKNIYEWLFAKLRRSGWTFDNVTPFLDLFRTFRNTLHNNGCFYPANGKEAIITWKNKVYTFSYGNVPDFYGWEFNLTLLNELIALNASIMRSSVVAQLPPIP